MRRLPKLSSVSVTLLHPITLGKEVRMRTANGLLRQYFPKSMEFNNVTEKEVIKAADKLNSRPRKRLGYKIPYEVFKDLTGVDAREVMGYA